MARIKIDTVPVLLSQQIISPENGIFVPIEPSIHSDFYPALEYVAQRAFFVRRQAERWRLLDESYHPRPTTLLGEYLKRNRLTEDDFRAFEAFHFGNRFFPGRLLRSLFLRWQQEQPESQRPLAALAKLADQPSGNELELLRLAAQRDRILQIAPSDPLPLRFYGLSLMRTYREQRSVLFIPNTAELELILDKLLELDRDLRRIYTLNLAEIAWDRGDEADFVRLAQFGLDPDPAKAGPLNFRLDPHAPTAVLARMIESFWRRGQLEQAWDICRQAREGGYLSERASYRDQWLELVYRKVEAHAAQTEDDSNKSGLAAK